MTVDIANGQTLTNLDLTDVLPNNMQFVAVDSTTIRGTATATTASSTPSTTIPGGTLTRRFASVTGTTAGNDAEMLFTFFIPLNNASNARVINATSGDDVTSINDARTAGNWAPIDTRDGGSRAVSSNITANDHTLEDKSIAIQKGVARVVDVNPTGNTPGDTLEYTLQFQVSDFFAFQSLVIDDTFTDGQRWDNSFTPQLAVNGNGFTLAAANIAAANFTLTPNYTPASPAPNDGTSNVIFRVSDEIIRRGQSGKMIGGCIPVAGTGGPAPSCASFNDGATTATVTFRTVIQDKYSDTFPSGDPSLNEGDGLNNTVSVSGSLLSETNTNNTTGQSEADGSSAGVSIAQGALAKSVYKINGADPVGSPPQMAPGDLVTYRLRYDLILGDFEQLSFTDYLPLPVFSVNDPDDNNVAGPAWSFDNTGALVPPTGQWKRGPADTQFARSGIVPTTSIDTAANSLRFTYGTFDDPANQAAAIDLLFTVTVSDDPFADGLFLTNQVRESDQDTNGNATTRDALVQIQLTEPVLAITKGVVATDSTVATFSPATVGPVAFTAPGSGCPRFSGTISSTGLTATPINSNLTGIDAGDRVTFAIVVQNTGTGLRGAFDIRVKDTLPTGFAIPGGGLNLCVRDGTGAAISTTNVGGGTGLLDQGIELTDPGPTATPAGALDPFSASSGRNIAIITFDLLAQTSVVPASTIQNTATLTNFAGEEAGADHTVTDKTDTASVTIASPTIAKSITATNQAHTTGNNVAIGEIVTYQVVVTVPEGTTSSAKIVDLLDNGLVFVDCLSITASAGVISSLGAFTTICNDPTNPAITNSGRTITYDFGTITNSNTDNTTPETITIVYTVVVLNSTNNDRGGTRNNQADWTWSNGSIRASAPNVTILEPTLQIVKSATPTLVDAGDTVTFDIVVSHTGASNTDAFDVALSDLIPTGLTYVNASVQHLSGLPPTTGPAEAGSTVSAAWTSFPLGSTSTIRFKAVVNGAAIPSSTITNTATSNWTSLPGTVTTAQSPYGTTSTERTGNTANPGGTANDYTASGAVPIKVADVTPTKNLVTTSESHTATPATINAANPALLAVGEIARYRLVVEIPESTAPNLQFQDQLPVGLTFLNDGTAKVAFVANEAVMSSTTLNSGLAGCAGLNIVGNSGSVTPTCPLPDSAVSSSATTNNDTYVSGTAVFFKFGDVVNGDSDADAEFVVIEFNALADNTALVSNDAGDNRNNTFSVFLNGGQSGPISNQLFTRIVEPSITNLDKTITVTPNDAGDTITYQVTYNNGSGANVTSAFDVRVLDVLPGSVTLNLGSVNATPAGGATGVTNNSAGNTVDITIGTVPAGGSVTITFSGTVNRAVTPGQSVTNTANLTYTSLPGATGTTGNATGSNTPGASGAGTGERDGSGDSINDYNGTDAVNFSIDNPVLTKTIAATSEISSTGSNVAIGEIVRYRLRVAMPESTISNLKLIDTLPAGLRFIDENQARVSFIADTDTTEPGNLSGADNDADPPTFQIPGSRISTSGQTVTFDLGDIVINDADANAELILIEFNALVENVSGNNSGDTKTNTFKVEIAGSDIGTPDSVNVTIVEPSITNLDKTVTVTPGDAGDTVTYQVTYANAGTATAFETRLTDALPADLTLITASVTVTPTAGASGVTDNSAGNTVDVTIGTIPVGGSVTLSYSATLNPSVTPLQTIQNTANLVYTSLPANGTAANPTGSTTPGTSGATNGERNGSGGVNDQNGTDNASITTNGYAIAKALDSTSATHTSGSNVTIGEVITYALTITLPEGTTPSLVITDNLPAGLVFVAGSVTVDTTAFAGTVPAPSVANSGSSGDDVTLTFGSISVTNDNNTANNSFIVRLQARVMDIAGNVGVNPPGQTTLPNSATAQVAANPAVSSGTVNVTVVEPRMEITKSIAPALAAASDTVTITLVVSNTGTSEAFEVVVNDPMPDAKFTVLTAATTPAGFTFSTVASAPNTIVRFTGGSIPVGENRTFVFTAQLTSGVVKGEVLTNVATVTQATTLPGTDAGERNEPDVSANAPLTISAPDLTIVKDDTLANVTPGQTAVYSLTVANVGDRAATGVTITDTVPTGTTFDLAGSSAGWSCSDNAAAGTLCSFTVGNLDVSASQIVRFAVTVDLPLLTTTTQIINTATTGDDGSHGPDPTPTNNTGTDTDPTVLGSLGNYVWLDANGDGQQQGSEAAVAGVVVNLYDSNGVLIATTTTDSNGLYSFTGLGPGSYTVQFVPPAGHLITNQTVGNTATDSNPNPADGRTAPITLAAGENNTSIDAGLYVPLSIGDTLWIDYNADGIDDPAEPGLAGVTVNLYDGNGNLIATTVTDPNGTYLFPNLPPGTYEVRVDQTTLPSGFTNTHDLDGNDNSSTTVTQPSGQSNLNLDFGYVGVPGLATTKRDALFTDVDNDGVPSPGDTLRYTIVISNTGTGPLSSIVFTDTPGTHTTLVVNSVQTTLGTVITGNGAGHTSVRVNVGTLPGKSGTTITFRVTINNPLPAGITQVTNQGTVSSAQLPTIPTDDPDTATGSDLTVTPVSASAAPRITKQSSLVRDADGNGVVSPGDTLRYDLRMVNVGNATTANIIFTDTPDANTTLVAGSVLTNKGTVTTGNSAGDTTVAIAVGDVNPGDVVLISFDVTVNIGLVTGTTLSNQGQIAYDADGDGTNDSTRPTDGDTTQPGDQPTTNTIGGSPEGVAIKSVSDVNGGNLEPGDILLYTIVLQNTSAFNAPGLVFEDPIPAHTVYLANSVSAPGASTVVSTTPTLRIEGIDVPARSQVLLSFRVQVINPLPAGVTDISNQGVVFFDSDGDGINDVTQPTDGDTVNPGNQPTVIPITAGPNYGETTKTVALSNDADGNGVVTPGDTLRYTIRIPNTGNQDSLGAVFLLDTIPANTTYVGGSAVADRGTASFNTGSNRVEWSGDVPAGTTITITFDVTINTGIVTGIVISNQGAVRYDSNNDGTPDATELTDSDTTNPGEQPTTVPVGGSPEGVARKTATDVNGGNLEPGDVLLYTIVLQNTSGFNVPGIEFIDSIPAQTDYITNSLTVPAGATIVTQSPTIRVTGVDVNALSQVTITFQVQITSPLPAGITQIANQGTVFYDSDGDGINDATQPTDGDPATPGNQPTLSPILTTLEYSATKRDRLFTDADGNGSPSPGDTLEYEIVVANTGNQAVTNVVFADTPSANTVLVVSSVQTSAGTITAGNSPGNTSVSIDIGTLNGGASVTISFRVTINDPLPAGVTQVANQGTLSSTELPTVITNDPDTPVNEDPTLTPVVAAPVLAASKRDSLAVDADGNGTPSPGDTIEYVVTIQNTGNQAATGLTFNDTPDANSRLVVGSVTTTAGAVTTGNGGGDTTVSVAIASIPGGASATITFRVTINNPVPAGVAQIANQGNLSSNQLPTLPTDDPDSAASGDPTITPISARPLVSATKQDSLAVDADGNGSASPGDTLEYRVTIINSGNQAGRATFIDNVLDPNVALVVGSVQTTLGTIARGNNPGDTGVQVNVGIVPGGQGTVIITFRVRIINPLPAGVTQLGNQATVSGSNFPTVPTDDPDTPANGDVTITPVVATPVLSASKRDTLAVDADANGSSSPGDTLEYRVTIQNTGNSAATGLVFNDIPGGNTALVVNSVQTSAGTVTIGNTAGHTTVSVNIGTIPGGGSVTITFRVTINDPLPAGVTRVLNQGTVTSNQLPSVPTDDPDTAASGDPTATPVVATPILGATKSDRLIIDADGNSIASPGDTILYQITIQNSGNQAATDVVFNDTPSANTALVVGSVQTNAGTVTTGNGAGHTIVSVNIGTIPGGGQVVITFRVTINNPLPAGVTQIANQGTVSSNQLPTISTDDPATGANEDPTVTPVVAEVLLDSTKRDSLLVDADGDGIASPGDTLNYQVVIHNSGNIAATDVVFDDTPGANTTLVVGSVQTSAGTVTTGNTAGQKSVAVAVGTIPGGANVTISFRVTINNPLPAGVTRVVNQGTVHSNELPSLPTDDPDTAQADDPTATPLTAAPIIDATKRDSLIVDADGNGSASPGDTIEYRIVVANRGNQAGLAAFVNDLLDPNVALVVGSVQSSQGTVVRGNTAGDRSVNVNLGSIPGGGQATITFRVTINNPLPAGVTRVANQAVVTGDNFPATPTDDPDTPATDDPTVTPVVAGPVLEATKRDTLAVDADTNGNASPGDTIEYRVVIRNSGNSAATGVVFNDIPDVNTALVVGSVQTSAGTVTTGNSAGNTSVSVNIGTIPGGGQVVITFRVTINNPLAAGVTRVVNQGTVSSNELPSLPTDDPDTSAVNDPTATPLTAAPILTATKRDSLAVDADGDGVASPGDTLEYRVVIQNSGNSAASGVVFNDTPDANTPLIVGSVQTSVGTVTTGNNAGDSTIRVDIGTLSGGGQVIITFRVTIANPLPAGVLSIANQGTVGSNELPAIPTDDPDTGTPDDPTETQLAAAPVLKADKRDSLFIDADGDGAVSPGDTILYETTIRNTGNAAASGVLFVDFPDPNTTLVVGSVQSSQGTVVTGNNAGDGGVRVEIGTIVGGGQVVITFRVTVNNPLPANVSRVVNQGTVTSNELPAVATNDPDTAAVDDPTVTPINAAPQLELTKTDSIFTDVDGNGQPSPGDVLQYRLVVRNTGNQAAVNIIVQDAPDPFTRLIAGSVQTTAGTVTTGNTAGDASVVVAVGTLPGSGGQAVITYRVTIVNPVPATVEQVANQALAGADNAGGVSSDDPDTPTLGDPTLTPVVAEPILDVSKRDSLFIDANGDGLASPGDTLIYQITILNVGNRAAANLVFNDTPDPNTALIVGTVQTNRGTVVSGNNPGNTVVRVNLGTLPGGGARADISFQVRITDTLPATVQQIANQGIVTGDNVAPAPSDDPDTGTDNDPTRTPVVGDPLVGATKQDSLLIDADGNGAVTAGDTLLYQVVIDNSGNRAAAGVVYTDTPDVNTTLIVGSVQTSIGTVTTGNAPGDRSIRVDVGELPARYDVTISYRVTVNNPLPAGVKEIRNQGTVTGVDIAGVTTDDPTSPDPLDPTGTTLGEARIGLTKQAQPPAGTSLFPGDHITYTLRLANLGTIPVTNAVITDSIPLGTAYVPGSAQPTPTSGPDPLVWRTAQLGIGEAITVSFSVEVLPVGQVTAIVNVGLAETDQTPVTTSPFVVLPFDPTDIDLLSFTATPEGTALRVAWLTGAEINTWGFHLWRSNTADRGQAVRVTTHLIPAQGRNGGGSAYSFLDTAVEPIILYWYWLEEVETDGSRNEYGPVSGSLSGPGSGVDGNHSLFLPLVGQGQATELTTPVEPTPTETEPPAEGDPPAETESSEKILLPVVNR